jgi:ubiquinone/menaquinone biosynthesis C-methylase UbiE
MRALLTALLLALLVPPGFAQPRYGTVPASPDGIGKTYQGREIAQVMSFHGADWLERPERTDEERPDHVLAALDLKPGLVVADIGAGSGFYSWRMGKKVSPRGVVYAVENQPEMFQLLRRQMSRRRASNVKAVLGTASDPRLPANSVDLAVLVDVYHELEFPHEMLAAIVRSLKPGGRLAVIEYRADDPKVPIKALHTMTEAQIRKEAAQHPLEWVKTVGTLPWQQVVVFRKKDPAKS